MTGKKFDKEFLEALKQEFLKASERGCSVMPIVKVPESSPDVPTYQDYLMWMQEKAREVYGMPASMLGASSVSEPGKALALAASSLNTAVGADLDSVPEIFGLKRLRHPGESDGEFRVRIAAMSGGATGTKTDLIAAVMGIEGVRDVKIVEAGSAEIDVHVSVGPAFNADDVSLSARETMEMIRPAGMKVNIQVVLDDPSTTLYEQFKSEDTEEERFMNRLRSKILERYPVGEE